MKIAAVASAFPDHYHDQRSVRELLARIWADKPEIVRRLPTLFTNCGVEGRHFALPLADYETPRTFGELNDVWIRVALELGEKAIQRALDRAGLAPRDVDAIFFSTVTGLAAPSLDARLANRLRFRPDLRRVPMFGLGCVAGAAAVSRAADFVRGRRAGVALVLTVELCSLNWQRDDVSLAHVISTGLFGDGATCAVVVGEDRPADGPRIVDTRSVFYPDTEDVMGWRISEHGFHLVLSPAVPTIARERLGPDVEAFLASRGLRTGDIRSWVCHPGGPKVLAAARDGLGLTDEDLALSWQALRDTGNLSSASALLILERTIASRRPAPGVPGVMLAMGPGFCSEILLLEW
ncbi:MAG: type III polyketide synthase [Planctomycetes bacterium]|nr:type III polyketide synthase [Planctomycetota bacterium]